MSDIRRWYDEAHRSSAFRAKHGFYQLIRKIAMGRYLDLSCGEGRTLAFAEGIGTDFSLVALKRAKAISPKSDFVLADSHSIPFVDRAFDSLSCLGSIEHFRDPNLALAEIGRVLVAGGLLLISVPNKYRWTRPLWILLYALRRPPTQPIERNYSVREFSKLLGKKGFCLMKVLNPGQFDLSDRGVPWPLAKILGQLDKMLHPELAIEPLYICVRRKQVRRADSR